MTLRHLLLPLAVAATLAACSRPAPPAPAPVPDTAGTASTSEPQTALGRTVDRALREARTKLEQDNIDISGRMHLSINGHDIGGSGDAKLPKAEITPAGDFLVEGKTVPVDAAQRALLLDYRRHIIEIAGIGMALGSKGADLAGQALGGVVGAIFGGKEQEQAFERRMEAQGKRMEAEAMQICTHLAPMLATQDKLAASLEAFKPYARLTQSDVDECGKKMSERTSGGATTPDPQAQEQIRGIVREEVQKAVREAMGRTPPPPPPAPPAPPPPPGN